MRNLHRIASIAACALAVIVSTAHANLTYDYRGPPFNSVQDPSLGSAISASVTLATWVPGDYSGSLAPAEMTSFAISSGPVRGFGPNCTTCFAALTLDLGSVVSWYIEYYASAGPSSILLMTCGPVSNPPSCPSPGDSVGRETSIHGERVFSQNSTLSSGIWTVEAVPEPSAAALFGTGLGLIVLRVVGRRPSFTRAMAGRQRG
jgi:hypothetical protein